MTRARGKPSEPALTRVRNYREHSCSRMFYGSSGHPLRSLPLAARLPLPLSFSASLWPLRSVLPSLSIRVLSPGRASLSWPRFSLLLCSGSLSLSLSLSRRARALSLAAVPLLCLAASSRAAIASSLHWFVFGVPGSRCVLYFL